MTFLEKAAKNHPDLNLPPPQIMLCRWFAQTRQEYAARQALDKAVTQYPTDPEAYIVLGNLAMEQRRVTEAELLFNKAAELLKTFPADKQPKRRDALEPAVPSGLAGVAESRAASMPSEDNSAEWAIAEKHLKNLLSMSPKDTLAMQRLARAMFWQKRAGECLKMLRKAYEEDSQKEKKERRNVLTPEAALGGYYEEYGDHKDAAKWMNKALQNYPHDLRTLLVVAKWELDTGAKDEALRDASAACEIDKDSPDAIGLRALAALAQKDYKTAERDFSDILSRYPNNFLAKNFLALALCDQQDPDKLRRAFEYARDNYDRNNQNSDALSTLGWVLYKQGQKAQAEQALTQAVQNGNLNLDTLYYLAQVLNQRNKREEARNILLAGAEGREVLRPQGRREEAVR